MTTPITDLATSLGEPASDWTLTPASSTPATVRGMNWRLGERVGSGSYGCVYKALDKDKGLIFAVKKAVLEESNEHDCRFRARLEDELAICSQLKHPHIVRYLGHEYKDSTLYIFLEYAAGGSMAHLLREFGPLEEQLLRIASKGLLEGLHYLHTQSPPVVHRDIKGANLLLDITFCVKLADFGCSRRDAETTSFTTLGSVPWMAPEVMQQQDGYGRKADVWSSGCTVIEMASAEKPWGNGIFDNLMFALRHIGLSDATPPIPEGVTESCRDLVQRCVQRSPKERPTAAELLRHEFVRSVPSQCEPRHHR